MWIPSEWSEWTNERILVAVDWTSKGRIEEESAKETVKVLIEVGVDLVTDAWGS